jgi:hypothetical protein
MKIRAELTPNAAASQIWVDDKEVSANTNSIVISAVAGEITRVDIGLVPLEIIHVQGEVETLLYKGVNDEPLVSAGDANDLWHCGCGTWNHVTQTVCRVCKKDPGWG